MWPRVVLDGEKFVRKLRDLNRTIRLSSDEQFRIWLHVVTVEYQKEELPHQVKVIESILDEFDDGSFRPEIVDVTSEKYRARVLFVPSAFHTTISNDPREKHPYSWFCRAILCLNYPKVPLRAEVEAAWRTVGEDKAALQPNLSRGEQSEFVREWLEPVSQVVLRVCQ